VISDLGRNPITGLSYSSNKAADGTFIGFLQGLKVTRMNGDVTTYGDYEGRHYPNFVLTDDFSFAGANGQVWLCGMTTHGHSGNNPLRVHGVSPHWCYNETVLEEACPEVKGYKAFPGRDNLFRDIPKSCKKAADKDQAGVSDAYVSGLASACDKDQTCGAFTFNGRPGSISSCLKTWTNEPPKEPRYPNVCYYKKIHF